MLRLNGNAGELANPLKFTAKALFSVNLMTLSASPLGRAAAYRFDSSELSG